VNAMLAPIHTMWLGNTLSRLELLTLASFRAQGHEVSLWAYDDITGGVPAGIILRDAETILPRAKIRPKRSADRDLGIGKGSVGGVFSDLFRYRVLYEHGGIWSDMDVTALRPLDFDEDYAFRPHRLGMVGSIMKAPRGSTLMREVYDATEAIADEETPWLLPIQILNERVRAAGMERFIRADMSNRDSWHELRPFIEERRDFPRAWLAVHWMNEFWRTMREEDGHLHGKRILDRVPDKDAPPPGSSLYELYRAYGLVDPYAPFEARHVTPRPLAPQPVPVPGRYDVLLTGLARGGAERIVIETLAGLAPTAPCRLHLLGSAAAEYPLPAVENLSVHRPGGARAARLRAVALDLLDAGVRRLTTHLIRAEDLETLWEFGIETIPVVHNARPGWLDAPTRYNVPEVPMVVACAEAVAAQLRESGLGRSVTVIRHELQARPNPAGLAADRRAVRARHGVGDATVLIGMVGQFKLQKAYHRAAKVLAAVRAQGIPARLMVLGGWDHEWGSGRSAYEAFMRAAVEAGVVADVIPLGAVDPAAPYYAAFDVYLNTSAYEGLSVAMLEAIAAGLPVVASDVGGAREIAHAGAALIADPDDVAGYTKAILDRLGGARTIPPAPAEPDLIPRLWSLIGNDPLPAGVLATGALVLTQNLELGGPQTSLVRLAEVLGGSRKLLIGVFGGVKAHHRTSIEHAGGKLLSAAGVAIGEQATCVVDWITRFAPRTLCFWNLHPELKLLLTKLLERSRIRIIDVSPGPMLFDELAAALPFQSRIAFSASAYFARLDQFVALYRGGEAPGARNLVLPLAAPDPPGFVPLPAPYLLPPRDQDPALVVGTICRIVPDKRVERLIGVARRLRARVPGALLMVVGGPDASSVGYFQSLIAASEREPAIRLLGPSDDPLPFLRLFRVFVLTGCRQGCPNALLEALAMGVPVVAEPDGGIAEQVIPGVTGYLAASEEAMARRVVALLRDEPLRRRLGDAGRLHVRTHFSLAQMGADYDRLLFPERRSS